MDGCIDDIRIKDGAIGRDADDDLGFVFLRGLIIAVEDVVQAAARDVVAALGTELGRCP